MDCLVLPVSILRRRSSDSCSRLGYQPLTEEGFKEFEGPVTVVVGKEQREFLVDPFVLEENPFRVLIDSVKYKENYNNNINDQKMKINDQKMKIKEKKMILVNVDAILFEHMLWLMYNDCSSLFQLNVPEIIEFYAQDF